MKCEGNIRKSGFAHLTKWWSRKRDVEVRNEQGRLEIDSLVHNLLDTILPKDHQGYTFTKIT
jgi:hypothetical protein